MSRRCEAECLRQEINAWTLKICSGQTMNSPRNETFNTIIEHNARYIRSCEKPKYENMSQPITRYTTFIAQMYDLTQEDIEQIVAGGFFLFGDQLVCFYCGLSVPVNNYNLSNHPYCLYAKLFGITTLNNHAEATYEMIQFKKQSMWEMYQMNNTMFHEIYIGFILHKSYLSEIKRLKTFKNTDYPWRNICELVANGLYLKNKNTLACCACTFSNTSKQVSDMENISLFLKHAFKSKRCPFIYLLILTKYTEFRVVGILGEKKIHTYIHFFVIRFYIFLGVSTIVHVHDRGQGTGERIIDVETIRSLQQYFGKLSAMAYAETQGSAIVHKQSVLVPNKTNTKCLV